MHSLLPIYNNVKSGDKENFDFVITNQFVFLILNYLNMKRTFTLLLVAGATTAYAQPKVFTQATVTTKTTIVASEQEEDQTRTFTGDDGQTRVIRMSGGDGETKTTTSLKNDLVKTFSESEMGRTTVIRDNSKKVTTTIMEMMGKKTGFYATDEDQAEMAKRMDSMMQSRGQNAGFSRSNTPPVFSIEYKEDGKKIAGYACKKALIIGTRTNGKSDTTEVWYSPDFKIQNLPSTGGSLGGFSAMTTATGPSGFENLNGFPMQYERKMSRGRTMTVQVTKLVTDKDIADKEFEIPKDIEVKPMKDMQNGGGPGFQIRIGG